MEIGTLQATENVRYYGVGRIEDFIVRIGRAIRLEGKEIAVFRTSDDRLFAIDNVNPHRKGGPLSEGIVSGHVLYDPLYDTRIHLETGKVMAPDSGEVHTYPVCVDGLEVQIGLPEQA